MSFKISAIIFLIASLLTACVKTSPPPPTIDPVEVKLAEAAVAVSHSLDKLAEVEQAANPQAQLSPPPNPDSYGMGRLASIDWSGPIEPLIARLASASGFHLKIMGARPAIPVMVTILARNTPMGDILRDAGYQANSKANIVVFPDRQLIEIHYAPA